MINNILLRKNNLIFNLKRYAWECKGFFYYLNKKKIITPQSFESTQPSPLIVIKKFILDKICYVHAVAVAVELLAEPFNRLSHLYSH